MKRIKVLLSAFAVLAIVAGAFAFKASNSFFFTSGSVFCTYTCPAGTQRAFKVDPAGSTTSPCTGGAQPYVLVSNTSCVPTISGTTFSATTDTNK